MSKSKTPEYRAWCHMRHRCSSPNYRNYHYWGGRGITVCDRWSSFENFLADMGPRPSKHHSLDRRNNNKGYCKSNCRWATSAEQIANRRPRRDAIVYHGKTVKEWATMWGMSYAGAARHMKKRIAATAQDSCKNKL